MSISVKHVEFCKGSIKNKLPIEIAGVRQETSLKFIELGYTTASQILGKYLLMDMNFDLFDEWLKINFPDSKVMNLKNRSDIVGCLQEWCDKNL